MDLTDKSPDGLNLEAARARLVDFLRGYVRSSASAHACLVQHADAQGWEHAAREEFLRRRLRLVTVFDDELLLAIGLGLIDVPAAAQALAHEGRLSSG